MLVVVSINLLFFLFIFSSMPLGWSIDLIGRVSHIPLKVPQLGDVFEGIPQLVTSVCLMTPSFMKVTIGTRVLLLGVMFYRFRGREDPFVLDFEEDFPLGLIERSEGSKFQNEVSLPNISSRRGGGEIPT